MNVLLIEPAYRAKFPPLGLMRLSTLHKRRGDAVTFIRGKVPEHRMVHWNRIYVSSLFTYELPRTVDTVKYYLSAVGNPSSDVFVGGIGATLLPDYIRERVPCQVITGPLDKPDMLGLGESPVAELMPDYELLDDVEWHYRPEDAYFVRASTGCIRHCKFCAVPILEPTFRYLQSIKAQIEAVKTKYGERQHLVALDNNILALKCLPEVIRDIQEQGFLRGAKRNGRKRTVDFNQGIDARLITPDVAKLLSTICLSPVRLAFDHEAVESSYRRAVRLLVEEDFARFTTYVMFNFDDTPASFYHRLRVNLELSDELGVRITGFPMRYVPIDDVDRHYISSHWTWRHLRGIQCILNATHGMVSPKLEFFEAAFGKSHAEFLEITAMPDRYIIYRNQHKSQADAWRAEYRKLSATEKTDFLTLLHTLHTSRQEVGDLVTNRKFRSLLAHYYPSKEESMS